MTPEDRWTHTEADAGRWHWTHTEPADPYEGVLDRFDPDMERD